MRTSLLHFYLPIKYVVKKSFYNMSKIDYFMFIYTVDVIVDHPYTAAEEDELSLRPGDIIRGVERRPGGWWRGELRGRVGVFPDNFVRVVGTTHDTNNDITAR